MLFELKYILFSLIKNQFSTNLIPSRGMHGGYRPDGELVDGENNFVDGPFPPLMMFDRDDSTVYKAGGYAKLKPRDERDLIQYQY
jgi:hypothetical protein